MIYPSPVDTVEILGELVEGTTLNASFRINEAGGEGKARFLWLANHEPFSTSRTVVLDQEQVGKKIVLVVSYRASDGVSYSSQSMESTPVLNTNDPPTGTLEITGTPVQGSVLLAQNTLSDLDGIGTISFQWYANGTPIQGQATESINLSQNEVGKSISVKASYTDRYGKLESVTSLLTNPISNTNDPPSGNIIINQPNPSEPTLSITSTLADLDGLGIIKYQWQANGEPIIGETTNTYRFTENDAGKIITVTAQYTDNYGKAEEVTSTNSFKPKLNIAPEFRDSDDSISIETTLTNLEIAGAHLQNDGSFIFAGTARFQTGNDRIAIIRVKPDGLLDPKWGSTGITLSSGTGLYASGTDLEIQANDQILVAGWQAYPTSALALRLDGKGMPDVNFSDDGVTRADPQELKFASSIAVQQDGKIVLAGTGTFFDSSIWYNQINVFGISRFNPDGSLDNSFSGDGTTSTRFSVYGARASSVAIQKDGKIIIAGQATNDGYSGSSFALARYESNGNLDTTFSGDGLLVTNIGTFADASSINIQTDGKIVVTGSSDNTFAAARYDTNGTLDQSFGKNGTILGLPTSAEGFLISDAKPRTDGKILLSGTVANRLSALLLNPDGSIDETFGENGRATTQIEGEPKSLTLLEDGRFIICSTSNSRLSAAIFNTDGSLSSRFASSEADTKNTITINEQEDAILNPDAFIIDEDLATSESYAGMQVNIGRSGGSSADDVFAAYPGGTLGALREGLPITVRNIEIGVVTSNSNGNLIITFSKNSTSTLISEALRQVTYKNNSDSPTLLTSIDWTVTDGNTGDQGLGGQLTATRTTSVVIKPINDTPFLLNPIPDTSARVGLTFSFTPNANTFEDPDDSTLSITATRSDGTPLPAWLSFDPSTHNFSGTPTTPGLISVRVTATDAGQASAKDDFVINVSPNGQTILGLPDVGEILVGSTGDDTISGLGGDDSLTGMAGNDRLDGGEGADIGIFTGPVGEYRIGRDGSNISIVDTSAPRDGSDTATNLERLKFADMGVNLTVQATAASIDQTSLDRICELYLGFFARVPAADGLENWINQFKNGKTLNAIADDFYGIGSSPGLRQVTGYWDSGNNRELSDQDFVKIAYRNVLGREGLEGGINYWATQLSGPEAKTRGELVATMLDAAQGLTGDATWGWVAELLDDKVLMSKRVAVEWGLNYGANATEAIAKGVEIANAITTEANPAVPSIPIKRYDFDTAIDLVGVNPANIDLLIS